MPLIEDLSRYGIEDCSYSPEAQKSNAYYCYTHKTRYYVCSKCTISISIKTVNKTLELAIEIIRGYLKYTQEYKFELSEVKSLKLRCYSDSDFATNRDDRVSMGGFITFIDETPISWQTFKQNSISLSNMEAEYVSLTEAAKEFIWLKNIINNKSLNLELNEKV
ncbi:retrovirus-related Pol polyprotein from transposon TNT 1-94 [Trichonephila clavipes]|nr:retrovirus-related Pol polyprotein from transposon TNT 1-94 [Trichonephila clavipes]